MQGSWPQLYCAFIRNRTRTSTQLPNSETLPTHTAAFQYVRSGQKAPGGHLNPKTWPRSAPRGEGTSTRTILSRSSAWRQFGLELFGELRDVRSASELLVLLR